MSLCGTSRRVALRRFRSQTGHIGHGWTGDRGHTDADDPAADINSAPPSWPLRSADTMVLPEPGGRHEAAGVHRWNGRRSVGLAASLTRATVRDAGRRLAPGHAGGTGWG